MHLLGGCCARGLAGCELRLVIVVQRAFRVKGGCSAQRCQAILCHTGKRTGSATAKSSY